MSVLTSRQVDGAPAGPCATSHPAYDLARKPEAYSPESEWPRDASRQTN